MSDKYAGQLTRLDIAIAALWAHPFLAAQDPLTDAEKFSLLADPDPADGGPPFPPLRYEQLTTRGDTARDDTTPRDEAPEQGASPLVIASLRRCARSPAALRPGQTPAS